MAIIRTSITVCPICQSENLVPWAGGLSGEMLCKECGYHGSFVIEKSVEGGEDRIAGINGRKGDEKEEKPVKKVTKNRVLKTKKRHK